MENQKRIPNRLINENSPYLVQHAYNPVEWYPWGKEAFDKAAAEDKPVFLSIGYSTCHWCHVMAHESFEDQEIADILNRHYVSIKVDKEERPDIDSIYMNVCQAFTGSGGWPTSIFMTPGQEPFFARTYFPKLARHGMTGFADLLLLISDKWKNSRKELIESAKEVVDFLNSQSKAPASLSEGLLSRAYQHFQETFDSKYGGFGSAPKFPTPHNLLFLMDYAQLAQSEKALKMAEKTLEQLYRGGIFDHIGYGFSRYSTDRYYLIPHFEKMLYDNALLMISYAKAYALTKKEFYRTVFEQTAAYVLRELASPEGGFYSAQDADSEGEEGRYYAFEYDEITTLLGREAGEAFNRCYGITHQGNFEGKSIPNLLNAPSLEPDCRDSLPPVYEYRKGRNRLHLDDKILTSWNGLMIAAFAVLYRITGQESYLQTAEKACRFIDRFLSDGDRLSVSWRDGRQSGNGFLDDYAFYAYAQLQLYEATLENRYLNRALALTRYTLSQFGDKEQGGFFLYGQEHEQLIVRPKETYDGAIPSGNSVMAYNLLKLAAVTGDDGLEQQSQRQLNFLSSYAGDYPAGHSFYLTALLRHFYPGTHVTCVLKSGEDLKQFARRANFYTTVTVLEKPTDQYPLVNDQTTYYICENHRCLPPVNDWQGNA